MSVKKPYRLIFRNLDKVIEVNPEQLPKEDGEEGSVLSLALAHGIAIDHACGGVSACSTCHIYVRSGLDSCNEASEDEEDQLDNAPGLEPDSRLACQCVPDGGSDIEIEIPAWNRNRVASEH